MKPIFHIFWILQNSGLVLAIALLTGQVRAAFVPLGAGGITDWEYEAPAGFSIADGSVSIAGDATTSVIFKLGGTFSDFSPVTVTFRTTKKRAEEYFLMNLDLKNMTGENWSGFQIEVADFYEAVAGAAFHPTWAHIHPGFGGSSYAPFTTLTPTTTFGKPGVLATGGTVTMGSSWLPTKLRMHDDVELRDPEEPLQFLQFDLTLTPIPEPSTYIVGAFLLLPFGLQGIRHLRKQRRQSA